MYCSVESCGDKSQVRGWCPKHYSRWKRYGNPETVKRVFGEDRPNHPLYARYYGMLQRCYNKNSDSYGGYGARGIKVCEEWQGVNGFDNFIKDMGERPDGYSLERVDNDGDYEPRNVIWGSPARQSINKRQRADNSSGVTGVHRIKTSGKWRAELNVEKRTVRLGYFDKFSDAVNARKEAEQLYHKPLVGIAL